MPTLREIGEDLQALEALLSEVGGDVSDEYANDAIDAWLAELHAARDDKLDRYCTLIGLITSRANARLEEQKRLLALATIDQNTARRLKERLRWFMEEQGERRIQTAYHRLTLADNGGKAALIIPDELQVPEEFVSYQTVRVIDKVAIRSLLESGQDLPFARLEDRGKHVRIT